MIGCQQAQELGIITVSFQDLYSVPAESSAKPSIQLASLSKTALMRDYQDCFDKIGRFPGDKYHNQLIDSRTPVVHPPRTVPVHILPLYKAGLEKMIADDIITVVTEPTDWVNSIVCNVKDTPDGKKKVRLCLDPKDLNKNIRREHYYIRTIDEILPLLQGKNFFLVVDTTKGYWHVELDHESSVLRTTFNTPFGRYRFKRFPFGVVVSQDIFQRKLDDIYRNIPNVTGIADDIIIYGSTEEELGQAFVNMLEATRANNVSLNSAKLQFKQPSVNFYGHTLTQEGIYPAADKLEAIKSRSSNIERECLALMFGLGIFEYYLLGRHTLVETDHSPLEQIFKKNIAEVPARLQRLLLRCMKFDVEVKYRRGETIPVADALSRVCFKKGIHELGSQESESCAPGYSIHFITDKWCPISMDSVKPAIGKDPTLYLLKDTSYNEWPSYWNQCPKELWDQ